MLRAAATPELFLTRGFARFASRLDAVPPRERERASALCRSPREAFAVEVPRELAKLFEASGGRALGDFVPGSSAPRPDAFGALLTTARRSPRGRARLGAYLAGTVPFGSTRRGELWLYVLGEPTSPSRGVIATLATDVPAAPHLAFRGASSFAFACALDEAAARGDEDASRVAELRACIPSPGVAEQEGVRAAFQRAMTLLDLITASDAAVRRSAKRLASLPFEPPHPPLENRASVTRRDTRDRTTALALGPLVEAFFRKEGAELDAIVTAQLSSSDALVREAATLLADALVTTRKPRTVLARELARRRAVALRAARAVATPALASPADRAQLTRRIVQLVDGAPVATDPLATTEPREEALRALAELGDRSVVPSLVARAVTGDVAAIDMLAVLGDPQAVGPLVGMLRREPQRYRLVEATVVRALATLDARSAAPALRALLADNPMPSWREGIERSVLVKELVAALGALRDDHAGPGLLEVLEARSQEYRAILPVAAWALGRIRHLPALTTLERLLSSPKEPPTCEVIWAVGEIGAAHDDARGRAGTILDRLTELPPLEPGAEMVRLTALMKVRSASGEASRTSELRRALERAGWEPAFRPEETSRRRIWALRSLEELAAVHGGAPAPSASSATGASEPPISGTSVIGSASSTRSTRATPSRSTTAVNDRPPRSRGGRAPRQSVVDGANPYFLGHEAVRYFVTRDDHRVRRAAEDAFGAWGVPVPETRRYYVSVLDDLEARGGLEALHEALRDPLGIFRHNIATRLAERAHASSVRPLAEATARLFAEPPTSTYEYDDAPSHLVAFVRALAKLNRPEGNDVLIEGLRAGNHQARAVVAENAPDDERFVPELTAMLGDPRSFLRSRAERSLVTLGASPADSMADAATGSDQPPPRSLAPR
jgi:hypothetical protein